MGWREGTATKYTELIEKVLMCAGMELLPDSVLSHIAILNGAGSTLKFQIGTPIFYFTFGFYATKYFFGSLITNLKSRINFDLMTAVGGETSIHDLAIRYQCDVARCTLSRRSSLYRAMQQQAFYFISRKYVHDVQQK
ncbi:hypothetical protein NQ318_009817 [Aromia moschata]|uniref:Uncharacterized protein n=1 Tax=Aromia moschata TaxID=1265417 RepID=A0AAV8XN75_9CUCU|nr:hypothetical protein NQ318_009817 [Aromia moschata]